MLKLDPDKFYTIGHRGNEVYDPENTLAAFKRTSEFGTDIIETDIKITKDGEFVLFHDYKLNKKTTGKGKVSSKTLKQIKEIRYNYFENRDLPICLLSELFEYISSQPEPKTKLILEIKCGLNKKSANKLITMINYYKLYDNIWIDSFKVKNLRIIRKITPHIFISRLYNFLNLNDPKKDRMKKLRQIVKECKKWNFGSVSLNRADLLPSAIQFLRKEGILVFGWAINDPKTYEKFMKIPGLSGFTAPDPKYMIEQRKIHLGY